MKPVMRETSTGIVDHVGNDTVTCIYEVEGDLVEQTYVRRQFLNKELPQPGDRIVAKILLCVDEAPPPEPTPEELKKLEELDKKVKKVRKPLEKVDVL